MEMNNTKLKFENHVILAGIILISTFLSWVDTFGASQNLWNIASRLKAFADYDRSGNLWAGIIMLYSIPTFAVLILSSWLRGGNKMSKFLSLIGGSVICLYFLIAILAVSTKEGRSASALSFILSPGIGVYICGFVSLMMIVNYFGMLASAFAGLFRKNTSGEEISQQAGNTAKLGSDFRVEIPINTQKAKEAAKNSVNVFAHGIENSMKLAEKNGLIAFFLGAGIGLLAAYQPALSVIILAGFIIYCGINNSKAEPIGAKEAEESHN